MSYLTEAECEARFLANQPIRTRAEIAEANAARCKRNVELIGIKCAAKKALIAGLSADEGMTLICAFHTLTAAESRYIRRAVWGVGR